MNMKDSADTDTDLANNLLLIKENFVNEKQSEKAIEQLEKIIEKHPRSAEAYRLLGESYRQIKDYDQAVNSFINSFLIEPVGQNYYIRFAGIVAIYGTEKMIQNIDRAIEKIPNCILLYQAKSLYLRRKKLFEEAISNYTKGIENMPNAVELYYNRADLFADIGRTEDAIKDYEKGLEKDPNSAESYWYFLEVAVLYLKNKKFDQALKYLKSLFQITKTDMKGKFSIFSWLNKEDFDKYLEICKSHLVNYPEDKTAEFCLEHLSTILTVVEWDTKEQKVIEKETCH